MKTTTDPDTGLQSPTIEPSERTAFAKVAEACDVLVQVEATNAKTSDLKFLPDEFEPTKVAAFCRKLLHDNPPPPAKKKATKADPKPDDAAGKGVTDGKT